MSPLVHLQPRALHAGCMCRVLQRSALGHLSLIVDGCQFTALTIPKDPNFVMISEYLQPFMSFPCDSAGKESTCNVGYLGLIPGLGRSPGEGKGYPLEYSGLENSMDCVVRGVAKSRTGLSSGLSVSLSAIFNESAPLFLWFRSSTGTFSSPALLLFRGGKA